MQGMMPLFLSILGGISLFAAINHFIIGAKSPKENREHVAFSALCIIFFMLTMSIIGIFRASTLEEYQKAISCSAVISPFYYLALTWFAKVFTDMRENRIFTIFVVGHLFFAIRGVTSEYGGLLEKIDGVYLPEQSWLGYHLSPTNPVYSVCGAFFLFLLYANLLYISYCAATHFRSHHQKGSAFLLVNALLYATLMTIDVYNFAVYNVCTYYAVFCFVPFLLLMSTHMTSMRHAESVAGSEEKYKRLLEGVQEDYVVFSYLTETQYIYISPSIEKILGYRPEDLVAGEWKNLVSTAGNAADVMRQYAEATKFLADGKKGFEIKILDKNGNPVLLDIKLHVLTDATGATSAIEGFVRDITRQREYENRLLEFNADLEFSVNERTEALQRALSELREEVDEKKSLYEQLLQAQKMESVGQLAGGVAHDFNNIMTAILGFSELAINDGRKGLDVSDDLEQILEAATRGSKLTEQLLGFARKQLAMPKVINPGDVLTEAMNFLPRMLGSKATVHLDVCDKPWSIKIDPTQFDQIIINLVVNARDAMLGNGSAGDMYIRVSNLNFSAAKKIANAVIPENDYVCVSVKDSGSGIPPELHQKIFEPFFSTKPVGKGSGLGLSVCYGVVKQYGGYIFVDSDVGDGATFSILLPRIIVSEVVFPARKSYEYAEAEAAGGEETLLLVEDDPVVALLTQKILSSSGYHVLTASNGLEALDVAERHSGEIDLVVTDVMMPKMDGKELADTLRLLVPDIAIICVSGYADGEIISELRHKGIAFLAKPYSPLQLAKMVRTVLDTKLLERNVERILEVH